MFKKRKRSVARRASVGLIGSAVGLGVAYAAVTSGTSAGVHATLSQARLVSSVTAAASLPALPPAAGLVEPDGSLFTPSGSSPALPHLSHPVVGWAARPGGGAWEVSSDGGVFSRGAAPFFGSGGNLHLARPVVAVAPTRSGRGYWLVGSDGGVFSFGDARFYGSTGATRLSKPIVGMASTPTGRGYWLVAADGGVFSFGDARYYGSTGNLHLAQPITSMSSTSTGRGYWLVASDGGVFSFGDGSFRGSTVGRDAAGAVSLVPDGTGYDEVANDGAVWAFRAGATPAKTLLSVPPSEQATVKAARAVSAALAEVGKPYVYGATGPTAFDCSGLTQYAYAQAGVRLPRTAAEQMAAGPAVAVADLRPGDLVYFYPGITHVGVYIGNGQMVDAPHTGASVRVESVQWFGPVMGATRPTA